MAEAQGPTENLHNEPAAADLSTDQYAGIVINSSGKVALAGLGAAIDGVLLNKPDADGKRADWAPIDGRKSPVRLGGTVAVGDLLAVDANGDFITASSGEVTAAKALEAGVATNIITAYLTTIHGTIA